MPAPSTSCCAAWCRSRTALLAVAIDLMPLPNTAPQSLAPFVTVCVVAYWTLMAPELMTPLATFAVGIVLDAAGGLPLGLTSLALLLVRGALLTGQRFLVAQPFPVIWGCFVAVALAVELVRWLVACLLLEPPPAGAAGPVPGCLTIALYPVVTALLRPLSQHLAGPAYAARS